MSRQSLAALAGIAMMVVASCSSGAPQKAATKGSTTTTSMTVAVSTSSGSPASSTSSTGHPATSATSATTHPTTGTSESPATTSRGSGGGGTGTWTTYFHDSGRSGVAPDGPADPASVHRLWATPALDGLVYAQPLVTGNTVIAATENDTVYALNALTGATLWSTHLGSSVPASALPCGDVNPVGITGTPVVDAGANRVLAVGLVEPGRDVLFELDLATGALVASTDVDPPGSSYTTDNQRGALALDANAVLVPFGGRYGDCGTYHGQVVSVPLTAAGLGTPSSYRLPTQNEGGFWSPPGPVVAPDGSVYITSGNSSSSSAFYYGDSVVHLSSALQLLDSFAPSNYAQLNADDLDLGSTNPVLDGAVVFQIGKSGVGYLLNASHLGGVGGQITASQVCPDLAMGGVSHSGTTLFVPCPAGLVGVSIASNRISVLWTAPANTAGPAIVTSGAVWTVATGSGQLMAVNPANGHVLWEQTIGSEPSRFISAAAGSGRIVVAASRQVEAFGN